MQDIYENVGHVLVCLGDPPGASLAMSLMWELSFVMKRFGNTFLAEYVAGFHERREFDKLLYARIDTVLDLLQHPWFERIWVILKVVVAKNVNVFYGNHSMTWSSFHEHWEPVGVGPVNGVLTAFHASRESNTLESSSFPNLAKIAFLTGYRMEFGFFGPKHLGQVLRLFLSWKSTENIDKIFAIIGLVDREVDVRFLKGLVDYKRPEKEIILELASHAVETGNALENLDLAGIGWEETFFHMSSSEEVKERFGTLEEQEEIQKTNEAFQDVDLLFNNPASKRRFCVTEKGYIGMVPHLSRVGDVVCVFFGAKVPFVVRSAGLGKGGAGGGGEGEEVGEGKYKQIGEAYIHGMMDGQALEMGHAEVDFTLI